MNLASGVGGPMTMTQVWIFYPIISGVLYESWTTSDRGGSPHRLPHDHKLHPWYTQMLPWILEPRSWTMVLISGIVVQGWWHSYGFGISLFHDCYMSHELHLTGVDHSIDHSMTSNYTLDMLSCYPGFLTQELEQCTSSVVQWSKDDDACMYMLSRYFMSVTWGMYHIWYGWITPQTTISNQIKSLLWSLVTNIGVSLLVLILNRSWVHIPVCGERRLLQSLVNLLVYCLLHWWQTYLCEDVTFSSRKGWHYQSQSMVVYPIQSIFSSVVTLQGGQHSHQALRYSKDSIIKYRYI